MLSLVVNLASAMLKKQKKKFVTRVLVNVCAKKAIMEMIASLNAFTLKKPVGRLLQNVSVNMKNIQVDA